MTLRIRTLTFDDFMGLLDLANKINIIEPIEDILSGKYRDNIIQMVKNQQNNSESETSEVEQVGFSIITEIAKLFITKIPTHKEAIYGYLAQITNSELSDIETLPMVDAFSLINDFFTSEDFKKLGKLYAQFKK
ncbi:hypothetical protein [Globicatella sp. PHS-GS-PNBC-21-1553]|uniref:hypothetical protein n=1 Tax=Globicatella sp. PHS-GS-PNBC-21-1553 TaxID=2885764 RepID=UPI00298EDC7C|nr:hypothetical protein [Globicatella sp. PHS-GS-PNBC-21-1553]WPC08011.1 hypothetical protein LB888_08125 [Globicatella sp. PHS-GS-PNBC-21-1553]